MKWPLVTMPIEVEEDVVAVRLRVKAIAEHLGFSTQDKTRIATAMSEIARNCYGYAKRGRAEVGIAEVDGGQRLEIRVRDEGGGIRDLQTILDGKYVSQTGLGLGIMGARRLMDHFQITSIVGGGTTVVLGKDLPTGSASFSEKRATSLADAIRRDRAVDLSLALRDQNRDLLQSLNSLYERDAEATRLNAELAETNRGVVALYAELERTAEDLRLAGETLEETVAIRTAELAESNERLRAEADARERLGEDLRQAQKMEAVGQLTGGIAHDFNNLLTGIVGSLDMMRRRITQKRYDKLENYIDIAMGSADRAASLTHRLLAFSRRQPLDPRITDVNGLLAGMKDLVLRSINETIVLTIVPCEAEATTLCDAHQLENAILNLAINSRDAMPSGGRLTITTTIDDPVAPGDIRSVVIAIADTGTGMAPDVVARAFDPFFTTKPLGKGTGLGLSMIYGFARQSRGEASIESSVGVGTTICIRLPFASSSVAAIKADQTEIANCSGHGERILVVEDDDAVRLLVVTALTEAGYRVRSAVDGPSGLEELTGPSEADLVVTDVGLPGLNGRQMADATRALNPGQKFLFMTGYAESAIAAESSLESGMALIAKPFTVDALLIKVRTLLT